MLNSIACHHVMIHSKTRSGVNATVPTHGCQIREWARSDWVGNTHQNVKELDMGEDTYRGLMGSTVWHGSTHGLV